jgi:hypothetical protein
LLDGTGALVDYSVFADTVATVDPASSREVIATYQADLAGRVTRFDGGATTAVATLLDGTNQAGPMYPFYFPPAVLYRDDIAQVTFVAASGAIQETAVPAAESRLYMRTEDAGALTAGNDDFTCPVSGLCNVACYNGGSIPSGCSAPSSSAQPVAPPVMIRNALNGNRIEAFYLYHEPPVGLCVGNDVAVGDSWLVRIDSETAFQNLIQARRFGGELVTGLSIVGGGSDIVLTKSGRRGTRAAIETATGAPVTGGGLSGAPIVESWREIH